MSTLRIENVDTYNLLSLLQALKDVAHQERTKGQEKDNPKRTANGHNLDALADLLNTAIIEE